MHKPWEDLIERTEDYRITGIEEDELLALGKEISTLPKDVKPHRMIQRIYDTRVKSMETKKGIDWATAEALAFAQLIKEGFHVRISGQDVKRGTFSHRHAVVHDQEEDKTYTPLSTIDKGMTRKFIAANSPLSEAGVLGYEYGYSIANPNTLTIWEAQFGDFANGGQNMFDQFISCAESKWH